MKEEMKKRYIVYASESEEDIKENHGELSLEKQIEECRKYVDSIGGEVQKVITDSDYSEIKTAKNVYQAIMDYSNDKFDGIVVYRLNRLTPSINGLFDLLDMAQHDEKNILSVKEKLDFKHKGTRHALLILKKIYEQFLIEQDEERSI